MNPEEGSSSPPPPLRGARVRRSLKLKFSQKPPKKPKLDHGADGAARSRQAAIFEASLAAYYRERREAAMERLAARTEQELAVPYEQRATPYLADDCLARGLEFTGDRPVLLHRLQEHDKGKLVLTPALQQPIVRRDAPSEFFSAPQRVDVFGTGEKLLLDIPHDVVRACIMRHVSDADLFSLLHTCKHVHADALQVIRDRAQAKWGPGGSPRALSALVFFSTRYATKSSLQYGLPDAWYRMADAGFPAVKAPDDTWVVGMIAAGITRRGSIDCIYADYQREKRLEKCQADEHAVKHREQDAREENCRKLLAAHGVPWLLSRMANRTWVLENKALVYRLLQPDGHGMFRKMAKHIKRGEPVRTTFVEQYLDTVGPLSRGDFRIVQCFTNDAVLSLPVRAVSWSLCRKEFPYTRTWFDALEYPATDADPFRLFGVPLTNGQLTHMSETLASKALVPYDPLYYAMVVEWVSAPHALPVISMRHICTASHHTLGDFVKARLLSDTHVRVVGLKLQVYVERHELRTITLGTPEAEATLALPILQCRHNGTVVIMRLFY